MHLQRNEESVFRRVGLNPNEIVEAVKPTYSQYISALHRLWSIGGHPDVHADGRPRAMSLTAVQRAALMRDRIGPMADLIVADAWHKHCYSPASSQALLVEVMGVLCVANLLRLLAPGRVPTGCRITFEEVHGRTNFDAVLRSPEGGVVLTIESKFTERGLNPCEYPTRGLCDGTWWSRPDEHFGCPMATPRANRTTGSRYWETAVRMMGIPDQPPSSPQQWCPMWVNYQMVHNIAETRFLDPSAVWLLIYDARNPYFSDPAVGCAATLIKASGDGVNVLSWQTLLSEASDASPRIQRLRTLHGL